MPLICTCARNLAAGSRQTGFSAHRHQGAGRREGPSPAGWECDSSLAGGICFWHDDPPATELMARLPARLIALVLNIFASFLRTTNVPWFIFSEWTVIPGSRDVKRCGTRFVVRGGAPHQAVHLLP